jgi:hypothetical protein
VTRSGVARFFRACLILLSPCFSILPGRENAVSNQLLSPLPDNITLPDPRVSAWLDAASEEGLQIAIMKGNQF